MLDSLSRRLGLYTLKQRLRFWVSLIIVTLGVLILLSTYFMEARGQVSQTNQHLKDTIALQRVYIERWFEDHSTQIRFLAAMASGQPKNNQEINRMFQAFISSKGEFAALVLVDADGTIAVDSAGPSGGNVADRDYFKEAMAGRESVTDLIISKNTGRPMVIISVPVYNEAGQVDGLVFGSIGIEALDNLMSRFDFGSAGQTYLLDGAGQFITGPEGLGAQSEFRQNSSFIYEQAARGALMDQVYINYAGEKVIGQYSWTKNGQWLIVAEVSYGTVLQPLYRNMILMTGIVLLVLCLSFLLTVMLTRSVERPIQLLLLGTKIIRDGNYDYRISREEIAAAPLELQLLCDTFNTTAQKLKSTIQLLEETVVMDQLTEVYNRRFILKEGLEVLNVCIRAGQPCSLLMIDLDFFKKINDTYGHLVGDRVILHAASILLACIRSTDMVSRYGGEEFLILMPNTEAAAGGLSLGERIRARFQDNPFREKEIEVRLTVSIGAAAYRKSASYGKTALEDMISRADQAMYKAKRKGRNRVEMLNDDEYEPESGE